MAITLTTGARNAACNGIVDSVDTGAGTATLVFWASGVGGTTLATFNLPNPAFGAAVTGVATLQGVTITATAAATGTVNAFSIEDRDGAEVLRGSVAASSADITIDSVSIASGQDVNLNSFTLTVPAS